ncbi:hypothetical protein THASP1DRAFT_32127 [Thamnocephalis sphaerospora]|uniref:Myb-like domain-containing protein n=1 Tax=Thamnocephalis sphaerospora TaxID=78915 RepID=A0A4P9XL97_9FUNG|nr:hypothetical protein THASP1DRAFT_32127 [Thamnocephalis sphaerospora]|eukprot:RKP06050.1 hypothetical protein THASP1DRAFT_32127 [Thamnocephalis sphaerospora]
MPRWTEPEDRLLYELRTVQGIPWAQVPAYMERSKLCPCPRSLSACQWRFWNMPQSIRDGEPEYHDEDRSDSEEDGYSGAERRAHVQDDEDSEVSTDAMARSGVKQQRDAGVNQSRLRKRARNGVDGHHRRAPLPEVMVLDSGSSDDSSHGVRRGGRGPNAPIKSLAHSRMASTGNGMTEPAIRAGDVTGALVAATTAMDGRRNELDRLAACLPMSSSTSHPAAPDPSAPISLARLQERLVASMSSQRSGASNGAVTADGKRSANSGVAPTSAADAMPFNVAAATEATREALMLVRSAMDEVARLQQEHTHELLDLLHATHAESRRHEERRWEQLAALFDRTLTEAQTREQHLIEQLRVDEERRVAAQQAADERRWEYVSKIMWMQRYRPADDMAGIPPVGATTTTTAVTTAGVTTHTSTYASAPMSGYADTGARYYDSSGRNVGDYNGLAGHGSNGSGGASILEPVCNQPVANLAVSLSNGVGHASGTTASSYMGVEERELAALNASVRLLRDELGERQTRLEHTMRHISMQQTAILQELRRSLYSSNSNNNSSIGGGGGGADSNGINGSSSRA